MIQPRPVEEGLLRVAQADVQTCLTGKPVESEAARRALAVDEVVASLRPDPDIRVAALLYVVSRTGCLTGSHILARYGETIASLVAELDQLGALSFKGAPDGKPGIDPRQAESVRRMLLAAVTDPRLVLVRLVEELHRLRSLKQAPVAERTQAATETRDIFAPLANRLGMWQLKWELEDLAFRYLDPTSYHTIADQLNARRADREDYVRGVSAILAKGFEKAGVSAKIEGRSKHIYSIWRKMQRKDLSIDRVFDIHGVRVLVETVADCYSALAVVHGLWHHIAGEFDDYIAHPKGNGYRSLHTAVTGPGGIPLEVQIRTVEMHEQSELGVAAHWRYKEGGRHTEAMDRKIGWLRALLQPAAEPGPSEDFIDRVRSEILEDRVYVLTPKGDVIELPAGATPLDFAYHVHTDVGHHTRGARVNGRMVPLTHRLSTGEQVEVITANSAHPSRDWLRPQSGYLACGRSRAKVRAWFRRQDQEQHCRQGRAMLERELQRLGLKDYPLQRLTDILPYPNLERLCTAVGSGEATLAAVTQALQRKLESREPPKRVRTERSASAQASLTVAGLRDLLSNFARCCGPVPPEPIAGYITQGQGVKIHRQNCGNFRRLAERAPDRILTLEWGGGNAATYPVHILVRATDREELVRDLTSLVADEGVSVLGAESRRERDGLYANIDLKVAITDTEQLARLLHRLQAAPQVSDVRRL